MSQKLKAKYDKLAKTKKPFIEVIHERVFHTDGTIHYSGNTLCNLRDPNTNKCVAFALARCNTMDNPTKKIGSEIAVGRALKKFFG